MGSQSTVIKYETLRSIDSASFTGSYQAIGSAFSHPARIFKIVNNSNVGVTISTDGINDNDFIPASTFVLYDVGTNKGDASPEFNLPPLQFYAKGSAGTGKVYVVILYAYSPSLNIPL